ncbi:hypothetical protein VNO80_20624 [Phaseolus coccineus]|uniref:Uncharacterized protein n=1 Tax=Phaseolus coccineus TaxID=3886 RepID=A0AAN9M1Q0_PHACN
MSNMILASRNFHSTLTLRLKLEAKSLSQKTSRGVPLYVKGLGYDSRNTITSSHISSRVNNRGIVEADDEGPKKDFVVEGAESSEIHARDVDYGWVDDGIREYFSKY